MLASLVGLQSRIDRGDYFGVKTAAGEQSNYFAAWHIAVDEPISFYSFLTSITKLYFSDE
jgi:hypothetical protein